MIELDHITVQAGDFVIRDVSMTIPTGDYGMLMGRTGCGKTTILEAICGLKLCVSGSIRLLGHDVTRLKPAERGIGFVPQDGALFSTMSVEEHLGFALVLRKWPRAEIKARVKELSDLLQIGHLLHRKPFGLSGGERQRVALGRALAFRPRILCLDEPLSALDYDTRLETCELLETIQQRLEVTVIHITHDRTEADRLADHVFLIEDGILREVNEHTSTARPG
ncbi:MAG: ABC transporter ATP-binding protein [Candidatus Hydrogenedentes bacterium]|nr:ABC transporter ATP-binding protein [Candidatus Hydrogenedentota bacterium]